MKFEILNKRFFRPNFIISSTKEVLESLSNENFKIKKTLIPNCFSVNEENKKNFDQFGFFTRKNLYSRHFISTSKSFSKLEKKWISP